MLKPATYLCYCCCYVPRTREHLPAVLYHLTNVPPNRKYTNIYPLNSTRIKGSGTEEDPFIVYRNSNSIEKNNLKHLRFVCMSDTHNDIDKISIPDGDVFVHCGDAVNSRTSSRDIIRFNQFVGGLPHKYKLFVAGNHCVCLDPERPDQSQNILNNMTYLQDQLIDIEGIKIYGSPWRPKRGCVYRAEAFGYDAQRIREDKWSKIPEDIDFLLTHGPPFSIRDYHKITDEQIGCPSLLDEVVSRVRPRVHLFGHMHVCRGASVYKSEDNQLLEGDKFQRGSNDILFVNLAIHQGRRLGTPVVIDYYYY